MERAMCSQKVVDKMTTEKQMDMLGLRKTIDGLATANGVTWYGHVLGMDDNNVLKIEESGKRKRGRPNRT